MTLNRTLAAGVLKVATTAILACLGALVLWHLYDYYTYSPQTRDGKIRADIVRLAADVSGQVTEVMVVDNQEVKKGDVLFRVDRERLTNALARANADLANARAILASAEREYRRYRGLADVVAAAEIDTHRAAAEEARAAYAVAVAQRDRAAIDLERAVVRSPVNGIVTNFSLRPGSYATAGQPVMAIVDSDSFYVAGYFEETKLANVHDGSHATIHVMGEERAIEGHVVGLAAGIEDRERTSAGDMLANVNPTFSWVRLAQRVPVRLAIDTVPEGLTLIAGRTATVVLDDPAETEAAPVSDEVQS